MKLTASLDSDIKIITRYFEKMFQLLEEARAEDKRAPLEVVDMDADESQLTYHAFSHFIKPDMAISLYTLVEFWMKKVCDHQRRKLRLKLRSSDIRGDDNLHAYHKYLTAYAGVNLSGVQASYARLQDLRKVRNAFVHSGGYVSSDKESEFSAIKGIVLSNSLVGIEDSFIGSTLEHANKYFNAAILA